jgi:hypothetical protein
MFVIFTTNAHTPSVWIRMVCIHCCWFNDQSFIVPSELPDKHWVPSLFTTSDLTLSEWPKNDSNSYHQFMINTNLDIYLWNLRHPYIPISFISLEVVRGSHTLKTFSVLPLIITVPDGFIARLYIELWLPFMDDAKTW